MWSCSWGLIAALLLGLGLIAAANIGLLLLGILAVGKRADREEQTRRVRDAHHREPQQVPEKVE
jgi:hypothetical protein